MREILKNIFKEEAVDYIVQNYPTPRHFINATKQELLDIPTIGASKAKEIKAFMELAQNALEGSNKSVLIKTPADIFEHLKIMSLWEEERFVTVFVNTKNIIIDTQTISKGSVTSSIVHPREVLSAAIKVRATAMFMVHNHPSGDTSPSAEDIETTKRMKSAADIIGINLLDHLIIGNNKYYSFKENGLI